MAARKLKLGREQQFLQQAMSESRATLQDVSMKAIGKPDVRWQAREKHLDMDHVRKLALIHDQQGSLAPGVIFRCTKSGRLILADGFHRHEEYRIRKAPSFPAYVVDSDDAEHEATTYCTMCNQEMCLPRTANDIRKALMILFGDPVWYLRSNQWVANHVGCSPNTVIRYRTEYSAATNTPIPAEFQTAAGSMRRNAQASPTARLNRDTGKYYATDKGENLYLGTDPQAAQGKLEERKEQALYTDGKWRKMTEQPAIELAKLGLVFHGRSHSSEPSLKAQFGHGVVLAVLGKEGDEVRACGRVLLMREDREPSYRAVILLQPGVRPPLTMDAGRRLGVEYLTPEELAATITPSAFSEPPPPSS